MFLRYVTVLFDEPLAFVMLAGAFVFSMLVGLSFHEFSHALAANALGDRTPARAGRLTLNPRAHLDPMGSILILFAGFGWAKPTPVNPMNTAHPKRAMTLIALAGPASNLVLAGLAAVPIKLGLVPFFHPFISPVLAEQAAIVWGASLANLAGLFLGTVVLLNVLLAAFNFLPLAPLDGFKVAVGLLPRDLSRRLARLEAWGPGLLFVLIALPWMTNGALNPISTLMNPLVSLFLAAFLGDGGGS
jgi:Zn-dependent protease